MFRRARGSNEPFWLTDFTVGPEDAQPGGQDESRLWEERDSGQGAHQEHLLTVYAG